MKSLVEEASSITKAIEKAWTRAGKPQSFSVKIFETPETSFLGFTKKSAKVGIFFEESAVQTAQRPAGQQNNRSRNDRPKRAHSDARTNESKEKSARPQRRRNDRPRREEQPNEGRVSGTRQRSNNPRTKGSHPSKRITDRPAPRGESSRRQKEPKKPATTNATPTPKVETVSPLHVATPKKRSLKISGRRFNGKKTSE